MTAILRKLGAANRTQAVLLAGRLLIYLKLNRPPPQQLNEVKRPNRGSSAV